MSIAPGRANINLGSFRDGWLAILIAASLSLGVFCLLESRSPGASVLDTRLALAAFALAGIVLIAAPKKLIVLAIALVVVAAYSMTAVLIRLIWIRSPFVGIAEIALGGAMLHFRPPAWHKTYFRLTLPAMFLVHGAYQLLRR